MLAAAGDDINDLASSHSAAGPMAEFRVKDDAYKSRSLQQQSSDYSIFEGQLASSEREEHFQTTEIHHKYETIENKASCSPWAHDRNAQ